MASDLQLVRVGKLRTLQEVADTGIRTSSDYIEFMGALMSAVVKEEIEPRIANAACQAGAQLLKAVELRHRFAKQDEEPNTDTVDVVVDEEMPTPPTEIGLIKCNQCNERMSPQKIRDHKREKHPVSDNPKGAGVRSPMSSQLAP